MGEEEVGEYVVKHKNGYCLGKTFPYLCGVDEPQKDILHAEDQIACSILRHLTYLQKTSLCRFRRVQTLCLKWDMICSHWENCKRICKSTNIFRVFSQ